MQKRQRYSAEFKREAVRQLQEGKQATVLARELGVPRNRLYKWLADIEKLGGRPSQAVVENLTMKWQSCAARTSGSRKKTKS